RVLGNYQQTKIRVNLEQSVQRVFDQLQQDVNAILPPALGGVSVLGTERFEETHRYRTSRLENDMMVLPIAYAHGDGRVEPASVMYRIVGREEGKLPVLERVLGAIGAQTPDGARTEV